MPPRRVLVCCPRANCAADETCKAYEARSTALKSNFELLEPETLYLHSGAKRFNVIRLVLWRRGLYLYDVMSLRYEQRPLLFLDSHFTEASPYGSLFSI